MTDHAFTFSDVSLVATARRALWLPDTQTLCVSDLHLGKSGRIARRTGTMLPPFETTDTLARLEDEINRFDPKSVICLGDSFDDLDASKELSPQAAATFAQLQAGRRWIWIEGNHDPGPIEIGGSHHDAFKSGDWRFAISRRKPRARYRATIIQNMGCADRALRGRVFYMIMIA